MLLTILSSLVCNTPVRATDKEEAANQTVEIVARVNGSGITMQEMRRAQADLRELRRILGHAADGATDDDALEEVVIKNLVRRHLLLQEAARRQLTVGREELDAAIAELRKRFEDLDSFGDWMKARGLGDVTLHKAVGNDLLARKVSAVLLADVGVSERQLAEYYEARKPELIVGQRVRLRIIAVESEYAAESILAELRDGRSFSHLARTRSRGKLADRGGDTGWLDQQALPHALREIVAGLQVGEASRPVKKSPGEFLVVALQDRRPIRAESLEQARPEIEARLLAAEQSRFLAEWFARQEDKAKIEVLPRRQQAAQDTGNPNLYGVN
jgi:parvulin-like peptidyl-prolyl isomerase